MSKYNIGDLIKDCELLERNKTNKRIELWHKSKSGFYRVYLFQNVHIDEDWLAYKETKDRDKAERLGDTLAGMITKIMN